MASDIKLVNLTTGEILSQDAASKHLHQKNQDNMVQRMQWTCCPNCRNWLSGSCQKYNAVPPAKVIVVGCEAWTPDLPF